jgi:signal peptidase I
MNTKQALRYVEYALTLLLFVFAAYAAVEYASGTQPIYVVSDYPSSMSPTMNYASMGVIYHASFQSLKVGDIIVFQDPEGYPVTIVHRIVAIVPCGSGQCLETKGDNNVTNPTRDPWYVNQADYKGQVVLIVPYLGYISPTLWGFRGGYVALPLIFVAFVFVLIFYMLEQRSQTKKDRPPSPKTDEEPKKDGVEKTW